MSRDITKKQIICITLLVVVLGLGLFIYDYYDAVTNFDGTIMRNEAGSGNKKEKLSFSYDESHEVMKVDIEERKLSDEEAELAFENAISEINATYLGANASANDVSSRLDIKNSYVNGLINASWSFSDFRVVSNEGVIDKSQVNEETLIEAEILLTYQEVSQIYKVHFLVRPYDTSTEDGRRSLIEQAIENSDRESSYEKYLKLPEEVNGIPLVWKRTVDMRGIKLALLGIATGVLITFGARQDEKNKRNALIQEKEKDYPMIVNELSILMGAGMSLRSAFERITRNYLAKKRKVEGYASAGYEEILFTYRQIADGVGELSALENLGIRCDQKDYRKLALLLAQNIKKGSKDLTFALEKEEAVAFEMRKQRAMRLGEEASTKLLIPMAGMLLVVIVILIVPAIMQMNV